MNPYKGFIKTKNKKSIQPFKDRDDLLSYEQVRDLPEYAGVLADGIILVDVDDVETSDIVLDIIDDLGIKCYVIDTTRGKHFMFRATDTVTTNKTKTMTAVGLQVDMKLGSRASYQMLKTNGVTRNWIRRPAEIDEFPFWLQPVKTNVDFNTMEAGDGRNQALFNYILTLQSAGLSKSDIIETIHLINDFVLPDPLDDKELDTILRDDSFKKVSFFKRGEFQHHEFAKYIKSEESIVRVNNVLHVYLNGVYSDRQADIELVMIKHLPQLSQARRRETLSYLELIAETAIVAPAHYIALQDGIFDLETDEFMSFSPDIIIKNCIQFRYVRDAYDEMVDKTLNKIACGDHDLRSLLEEMVGYLLLRRNELGKAFILTGSGSNGKSTLIDMIKHFLGDGNYSSLAMNELGQRFKTAEVFGKLANLGDDISSQYIDDNAVFKKLVTGETVNAERKGRDPFDFNNYAKMIFSANQLPRINDTTDGLMRRLIIIPFNAKFSSKDDDFDPFIKDKLITDSAMEYFLRIALEGLKRVLNNNKFTMPTVAVTELEQYELMNNPLLAFISDDRKIHNELTRDVYLSYSAWCHSNGLRPLSQIQFSREICKRGYEIKIKKIDSKSCRVFSKNM
ncbi:putative DNA primase/helicase [Fontibacillus solani]|uniref:Putative DNA primase/helicase n=1 Tax=Fontibacillus solani TaxID=1572857 RepID=A0A7W3SZH0_9BACL|nr:DNA primase family protein [Fontibacillus solani]MBA9088778.1 putative DNA primase/helicase [Fontibacillus solani]